MNGIIIPTPVTESAVVTALGAASATATVQGNVSIETDLTNLETEIPHLRNLHFTELIKDEKMSFEYKLKEGPCPSTNALQIMKIEGLPT